MSLTWPAKKDKGKDGVHRYRWPEYLPDVAMPFIEALIRLFLHKSGTYL